MRKKTKRSVQGTKSFQDTMSQMALNKFAPFIQEQILVETRKIASEQSKLLQSLITRLLVLEDMCTDEFGLSKEELSNLVADKEDEALGFEKVESAQKGDKIRVTIATKAGDGEYSSEAKYVLNELGKDLAVGQIEEALTGKSSGETVEVKMSEDKDGTVHMMRLKVDRVSRLKTSEVQNENA